MATVLTNVGEDLVADFFDGTAAAPTNWFVAWGTGAGTAVKGDTTLFTEAAETREIAAESQPTSDTNRLVATIVATAARTITNAGLFTLVTSGVMAVKGDFTGIVLSTSDSIEFTFDITWA